MVMASPGGDERDPPAVVDGWGMTDRRTILLVDDEVDVLDSLKGLWEALIPRVEVVTATRAAAALELLAERRFDLIISDYKMPGMNGIEFLAQARILQPDTPRVLFTAFAADALEDKAARESMVLEIISKTTGPEEMADLVRQMLPKSGSVKTAAVVQGLLDRAGQAVA